MPTWTYFYLLIAVASGIFSIYKYVQESKTKLTRDVLSVVATFVLFLIAYDIINVPQPAVISTISLTFILFASVTGIRDLEKENPFYTISSEEFAKTVELGEDESFDDAILGIKVMKYGSMLLIAILIVPLFYVYSLVFTN